VVGELTPG